MSKIDQILTELSAMRAENASAHSAINGRIDSLHARIDKVIDSIGGLRADLADHVVRGHE